MIKQHKKKRDEESTQSETDGSGGTNNSNPDSDTTNSSVAAASRNDGAEASAFVTASSPTLHDTNSNPIAIREQPLTIDGFDTRNLSERHLHNNNNNNNNIDDDNNDDDHDTFAGLNGYTPSNMSTEGDDSIDECDSIASTIAGTHADESAFSSARDKNNNKNKKNGNTSDADDAPDAIATKEQVAVNMLKIVLYTVLFIFMMILSLYAYQHLRYREKTDFESDIEDDSILLLNSIGTSLERNLGAMDAFVVSMVSYAKYSNQSWPFVTIPDHAMRLSKIKSLSKAVLIQQYHIVSEESSVQTNTPPPQQQQQRIAWEQYTIDHDDTWIQEALETQSNDPFVMKGGDVNGSLQEPHIYYGPEHEPSPLDQIRYTPTWQSYPIEPGEMTYNWNALQHPRLTAGITTAIDTEHVVLGEFITNSIENENENDDTDNDASYDWLWNNSSNNNNNQDDPTSSSSSSSYEPIFQILYPVLDTATDANPQHSSSSRMNDSHTVAVIGMTVTWTNMLQDIVPSKTGGLHVVIRNDCSNNNEHSQSFTYRIDGQDATFVGAGDLHNTEYDDYEVHSTIDDLKQHALSSTTSSKNSYYSGLPLATATTSTSTTSTISSDASFCDYTFHVYPTQEMRDSYFSSTPLFFSIAVIFIFAFTYITFAAYDMMMTTKQAKVMTSAKQSNAIVMSLFPSNVRSRLYIDQDEQKANEEQLQNQIRPQATKTKLKNFLNQGDEAQARKIEHAYKVGDHTTNTNNGLKFSGSGHLVPTSRPIADLFPETTVLFADIATFTAWSSVRDPTQVFTLLETIYGAFDTIANRRGVFKVETIGDSYVAVAGLPEPRPDHAEVMIKFASDCRDKFTILTRELETYLGPDTGELAMRFGLHSGPTTAGVLRGQKSRFQLFGDTVNTASRMESTGASNLIHVSQATANILVTAKKGHWLKSREDAVDVKGKGQMQTYWVEPKSTMLESPIDRVDIHVEDKTERLVGWVTDVMGRLLVQVKEHREVAPGSSRFTKISDEIQLLMEEDPAGWETKKIKKKKQKSGHIFLPPSNEDGMVLSEVKEIIELPDFDATKIIAPKEFNASDLDKEVFDQLKDYVSTIANLYNENPFHNFMHAAHVCMSVAKLMNRIVSPNQVIGENLNGNSDGENDNDDSSIKSSSSSINASGELSASPPKKPSLHDHTYGIISDPLTQFACVFAALIHDVDHPGIPNQQMVKEQWPLARKYQEKSIAEQNSVDMAWSIFLDPKYVNLRDAIFETERESRRFRQLVVNSVMATDIMDKDLKALRNYRWEKAFADEDLDMNSAWDNRNRKATIVIEHLIQASDIAHTMQHWHVYRKWNERLFEEMSFAYNKGRAEKDPAEFWYEGELGFFDFYIIPLTEKLRECGVFGVSSDELLSYAVKNREEWERRGKDIVAQMVQKRKASLPAVKKLDRGCSMRGERRIQTHMDCIDNY